MADTTALRAEIETLDVSARAMLETEEGELRELTPDEVTAYDENRATRAAKLALLERHTALEAAAAVPAAVVRAEAPNVIKTRDALDIVEDRSASTRDITDAVTRSLEAQDVTPENMDHVRKLLKRNSSNESRAWAQGILLRSTELYTSAFSKLMSGREWALTTEERTVLGVSTNANGKFLLPTHLDPTIILTSALSTNEVRKIARVVELTKGEAAWNGITSAGVTASWDGEVVEVSDDSPTFGNPSIPTVRAQALVQGSISAFEDIANLGNDVMMMFADAKDRLEGAAHATGVGTTTPKGVFTAVHAVSGSRIVSTTAATIGLVDLNALYGGVPKRYRGASKWLLNPTYAVAVKALGTALSASYSGDLRDGTASRILDKEVVESDDAPTLQTTTALDDEVLLGDFNQFVVVDRPGSMTVDYIPHLFNTANNLPDGRRAYYATWRNGSDVTNADAFRLLVDKTTA